MKRIVRFGLTTAAALLLAFTVKAQDINEAIDLFNKANQGLQDKQYDQALADANKAYQMVQALGAAEGEEVATVKTNCEKLLQAIPYTQGKELLAQKKYDEAAVKLTEAKTAAEKFSNQEIVSELTKLIPQISLAKATDLLAANDFQNAIPAYQAALATDPDNAEAYVHLGYAYDKMNDEANAISNYEKAVAAATKTNDEKDLATAKGQLGSIYLKKSAAAQQTKNWAEVAANAQKSLQYNESPQASLLGGLGNYQLKKYDAAITNLEKAATLEQNPQTLQNIAYYLALSYEAKGNKPKACQNYKKIKANPQFKAFAESKLKALACQ